MSKTYENWKEFENLIAGYPYLQYEAALGNTDWAMCKKCKQIVTFFAWDGIEFDVDAEREKIENHQCQL